MSTTQVGHALDLYLHTREPILARQQGVPAKGQPGHPAADFFREEYLVNYDIFTAKKPQVHAQGSCLLLLFRDASAPPHAPLSIGACTALTRAGLAVGRLRHGRWRGPLHRLPLPRGHGAHRLRHARDR